MSKRLRNALRMPGLIVRVPLVLLIWAMPPLTGALVWLAEHVFQGLDR